MNEKQAHATAAKQSKAGNEQRYVVYVCDQGYDVYSAEQTRMYAALIFIEAAYLKGVKVSAH